MIITPDKTEPELRLKNSGKIIPGCYLKIRAVLENGEILENYIDYVNTETMWISAYDHNGNAELKSVERYVTPSLEHKIFATYNSIEIFYNDQKISPIKYFENW